MTNTFGLAFALSVYKSSNSLTSMDLILMFFLLGLGLQGIKATINYLINRSEDFNETILSRSNEMEYANLLAVPTPIEEIKDPKLTMQKHEKVNGKEVFLPTPLH